MNNLSDRLRAKMNSQGLTQAELADLAGVSQVTIHKMLTRKILNSSRIVDIARALGVTSEWLSYGVEEGRAPYTHANMKGGSLVYNYKQLIDLIRRYGEELPSEMASTSFWVQIPFSCVLPSADITLPKGSYIYLEPTDKHKNKRLIEARYSEESGIFFVENRPDNRNSDNANTFLLGAITETRINFKN